MHDYYQIRLGEMATPLSALSKYTGPAMIVLGVLLMISFVIGDAMPGQNGQRENQKAKDTVAAWNGGYVTEGQLGEAIKHRNILAQFQQRVYQLGQASADEAGVGELPLRVSPVMLPVSYEQRVEEDIIWKKIFAQQALDAGMVVSDEVVSDYLNAIGRDRVSKDQMREIIRRMSDRGSRATIDFVFDLLREALLARNYIASHAFAMDTTLPSERYEDWLKCNDQIVVEAAPIRSSDFLDQVGEPSEEELKELFAEFKERVPMNDFLPEYEVELRSPYPAFAQPEMVSVQYLKADFNKLAESLEESVTDEEIAKYYEENKESFIKADEALFGDDSLFEDDDEDESTEQEESEENVSEETEAEEATPEEDTSESSEAETTEEASDETDSNEMAEETDAEQPATDEPVEEEEEEEETADTEADAEVDDDKKYQPLEEVSDEIRKRVGQQKAVEEIGTKMRELKLELELAYEDYFSEVLDAEDLEQEIPSPPATLSDLSPLAEKYGLELDTIEKSSLKELRENPIGMTRNLEDSSTRNYTYWVRCFGGDKLERFEPALHFDSDSNLYLLLVSERQERKVLSFEEAREKVVEAWRNQEASKLALAEAEKLAKEANDNGSPLSSLFLEDDDRGSFETAPFAFLRVVNISQQDGRITLGLSQPDQIIGAGPDLMTKAFELKTDEVGAVLNHDQSIAYLLRVAAHVTPEDELHRDFLREGLSWYGLRPMQQRRTYRAIQELRDMVLEKADINFARDLDKVSEQ